MVISFSVKEARDQLMNNGTVYTFRWNRRKRTGKNWANEKRGGKKIADVFIDEPRLIETVSDLDLYVSESGFETRKEWLDVIMSMSKIPKDMRGLLYKVTTMERKYCCFAETEIDCIHPALFEQCNPGKCFGYWDERWPYGGQESIKSQQLRTKKQ